MIVKIVLGLSFTLVLIPLGILIGMSFRAIFRLEIAVGIGLLFVSGILVPLSLIPLMKISDEIFITYVVTMSIPIFLLYFFTGWQVYKFDRTGLSKEMMSPGKFKQFFVKGSYPGVIRIYSFKGLVFPFSRSNYLSLWIGYILLFSTGIIVYSISKEVNSLYIFPIWHMIFFLIFIVFGIIRFLKDSRKFIFNTVTGIISGSDKGFQVKSILLIKNDSLNKISLKGEEDEEIVLFSIAGKSGIEKEINKLYSKTGLPIDDKLEKGKLNREGFSEFTKT